MPSQFTVTVVLTLKFIYKRSFGYKITKYCPPKLEKCGEWQKLSGEHEKDIKAHKGFPNLEQIRKTKYPGDESFGKGDTEGAEIYPFSNISLSCKRPPSKRSPSVAPS